jgi:hypothetical protein
MNDLDKIKSFLDVGKMLQEMSGKLKDDTAAAIYLCEMYKKIICVMLTAFNVSRFVISEVASNEYEQDIPMLEVFASENGEIVVQMKINSSDRVKLL